MLIEYDPNSLNNKEFNTISEGNIPTEVIEEN
jgi:hypothetical protein